MLALIFARLLHYSIHFTKMALGMGKGGGKSGFLFI